MVIGPTGTGKSTIVKPYLQQGYIRLNRDTRGGRTLDLLEPMIQILQVGQNIILDNTHLTPNKRIPFVSATKNFGATIECQVMQTSAAEAQVNIVTRMIKMGINPMDLEVIKAHESPNVFSSSVHFTHHKEFAEPTEAEGFDKITYIPFVRELPDYTNKAIILDYDGTLRISTGEKEYPLCPDDVQLLAGRAEILKQYKANGYLLLGASNQSAVGKGLFTYEEACACFDKTNKLLGVDIDYLFCPHKSGPIVCWCRKPMPGMGIIFVEKYKLDRNSVIMVGDQTSDKTFAQRCGFIFQSAEEFFGNSGK